MPFGLTVTFEDFFQKGKSIEIKKILIALAGPAVNLIIIAISAFLITNQNLKQTIIYSNILIFIFNMMPLYPLDGGRIMKSLLRLKYDRYSADIIINRISNIILLIITVVSSILILYFQNIAILFVDIYLWIIIIGENKRYNMKKKLYDIMRNY